MKADSAGLETAGEELLFFSGEAELIPVYLKLRAEILALFPDSEVRVQKSQISFRCPHPYAWVWTLGSHGRKSKESPFMFVTFAAPFPIEGPLIHTKTEPYPGRWTHHVAVSEPDEITVELLGLIQASQAFRNTSKKRSSS